MECYVITGSDILLETLASIDFFLLPPFRGFVGSFVGMLPEVGLSFVATRSFPIDADAFAVRLAQRCSTWESWRPLPHVTADVFPECVEVIRLIAVLTDNDSSLTARLCDNSLLAWRVRNNILRYGAEGGYRSCHY